MASRWHGSPSRATENVGSDAESTGRRPAPPNPSRRRALCWLRADQTDLVAAVAEAANLNVVAAGAPGDESVARPSRPWPGSPTGESPVPLPIPDLRRALATVEADLVLLADLASDEAAILEANPGLIRDLRSRGVKVASLEPFPASVVAARAWRAEAGDDEAVAFLPLLRRSRGFARAEDALETFGRVRTLAFSARSNRREGSLAARLFDAMDAALRLLGEPESIDASVAGPHAGSGLRLAAGDSLADLAGDLTAHLRYPDDRSASLALSDQGGRWFRGVTLLGEGGCARFDETTFEWITPQGDSADESSEAANVSDAQRSAPPRSSVEVFAEQVDRLLDPRAAAPAPTDRLCALAMAEAAVLSARTAQPESPATILKMSGGT